MFKIYLLLLIFGKLKILILGGSILFAAVYFMVLVCLTDYKDTKAVFKKYKKVFIISIFFIILGFVLPNKIETKYLIGLWYADKAISKISIEHDKYINDNPKSNLQIKSIFKAIDYGLTKIEKAANKQVSGQK
jgi:hypothetical protein